MRSVHLLLLLPLAACAGAKPQAVASSSYNLPNVGGAGLTPIGVGGLSADVKPPSGTGTAPGAGSGYNFPQAGGAGQLPVGQGGIGYTADLPGDRQPYPRASSQPAGAPVGSPSNYNLPDAGGAGLVPIDSDGVRQQPIH